jgi:hypothetical protein
MNVKTVLVAVFAVWPCISTANQAHQILQGMSGPKRNEAMTSFMARSGEPCNVTRSFYQGVDARGNAFWNVACSNKKSFSVMIYNDSSGSTRILECKVMKAVGGTPCFQQF